ncbi:hypothetical protein [Nocardia cyriacigeorgica]|nr:hypothetical protein [Nocardia cyriacigeorgica]
MTASFAVVAAGFAASAAEIAELRPPAGPVSDSEVWIAPTPIR